MVHWRKCERKRREKTHNSPRKPNKRLANFTNVDFIIPSKVWFTKWFFYTLGRKISLMLFRILGEAQFCSFCHAASLTEQWCRYKDLLSAHFLPKVE